MKTTLLSFLLTLSVAVPVGAEMAKGRVFHDRNGNGTAERGEPGVAGVMVSNGEAVVKTGRDGSYMLPVDEDTIIFVIQPRGWSVPLNENNLPRFYYIHKPAGSPPDLKYAGVAPTGPLPDAIDFPLIPSPVGERFSFFAFGDPQPYSMEDIDYYRRDIVEQAMLDPGPVAGVTLGDIVGDDLDLFEPINAVTALMGRPWWHVYGNHDMNFDVDDPEHADETFERVYGPANYAFQIGRVTFIALDNVIYPNPYTDRLYVGGLNKKQLAFIENVLAHVPQDDLVVTMTHIPLFDESYADTFLDEHREQLFQLFKNHKYTLSLSAHTHTQQHHFFDHDHDHWPHIDHPHHHYNVGTTSGSWWRGAKDERGIPETTMRDGTPNGYAILHFDGNAYSYDYIVADGDRDEVMSLYAPKTVERRGWEYAMLAVNFYNGSEQATVEYRVEDGEWRRMSRTETVDPQYALNRYARDRMTDPPEGKSLPYPVHSTHLWTARLPTDRRAGLYRVDVRVTDRFGRVFEDSTSYRIKEPQ